MWTTKCGKSKRLEETVPVALFALVALVPVAPVPVPVASPRAAGVRPRGPAFRAAAHRPPVQLFSNSLQLPLTSIPS